MYSNVSRHKAATQQGVEEIDKRETEGKRELTVATSSNQPTNQPQHAHILYSNIVIILCGDENYDYSV